MQATDKARAAIEGATGRDEVLDRFFDYAKSAFKFAVLFVVRSDVAHGRSIHGLGAPTGLVARLQFKTDAPGLFARAAKERRVFVGSNPTSADNDLFGNLGRALPSALVAPVVVKGRVVAILLADGPADDIAHRASAARRGPLEVGKEDLTLVTGYAGDALEKHILRRKEQGLDASGIESNPSLPSPDGPPSTPRVAPPTAAAARPAARPVVAAPAPRRSNTVLTAAGLGVAAVAIIAGVFVMSKQGPAPGPEAIVTPPSGLAGFPHAIDPKAVLEIARKAADLRGAELLSIRAETTTAGRVDLDVAAAEDAASLTYTFGTADTEAEVRVDHAGVHSPHKKPREKCGGDVCARPVAPPQCSFEDILKASLGAGLREGDHPLVVYSDARAEVAGATQPAWSVSVNQRGSLQLDAKTCKPSTREMLRPPAIPLSAIPNARRGVDPLDLIALARTQAGFGPDVPLYEIEARGVTSGGRTNLAERDISIIFSFGDPPSVPAAERRFRRVFVTNQGIPLVAASANMPTHLKTPVEVPKCTFAHAHQVTGAAFSDSLAQITYGPTQDSPDVAQWSMDIPNADLHLAVSDSVCVSWDSLQGKKAATKKK